MSNKEIYSGVCNYVIAVYSEKQAPALRYCLQAFDTLMAGNGEFALVFVKLK